MDRATQAAIVMTIGCVVAFVGVLFVVPALTSAPKASDHEGAVQNQPVQPAPQNESPPTTALAPDAGSPDRKNSPHHAQVSRPDEKRETSKATPQVDQGVESVAAPASEVKSIRMFPPFPEGRIKWQAFELPVVPATRQNVLAYRHRMAEFYDEFDRAAECRTRGERVEQAGRFILSCDSKIGFEGVVVPDSYVEWTKLFVQVVQIRAESMYIPWGMDEVEFLAKHKQGDIHSRANALLERLTSRPSIR